jgi:uncharacterized membrane protein
MNRDVEHEVGRNQLRRLGTLTDCVYALALVAVMRWLPLPAESAVTGSEIWILELFAEFSGNIVTILIGLAFIIIYWLRSNQLSGHLERTDGPHTALSITSLASLLLLLYIMRVSAEVANPARRAGESVAVFLIGATGAAAWIHVRRKGLVRAGISAERTTKLQLEAYTEPIVALITLPFAYVGEVIWNVAWLAYFPVAALIRRLATRAAESQSAEDPQ